MIFARTVSTCPNYNLNISPSPARTISTCPTYTQSHLYACAQYCFNRGDDDASQSINMNIIHNHLNCLNYTGEINKTQSHKEFKSIIYQLMPICFGILKFQSTFYNSIFLFITPVLVPMPVTSLIRDHHLSPLPLVYFHFFNL